MGDRTMHVTLVWLSRSTGQPITTRAQAAEADGDVDYVVVLAHQRGQIRLGLHTKLVDALQHGRKFAAKHRIDFRDVLP